MIESLDATDAYVSTFARQQEEWPAEERPWLRRLREEALNRFRELGFPTTKDEEWKYTNVSPLLKVPFRPAAYHPNGLTRDRLRGATVEGLECTELVFVNGQFAPKLSSLGSPLAGVVVGSLAEALRADPDTLEPYLGRYASFRNHAFVALNTAFLRDGAFVRIPRGVVLAEPIHLLFLSTGDAGPGVAHPRILVVAEESSQAVLVETYAGLEPSTYFTNAVTEVVLGRNAALDHYRVQQESEEGFHFATLQVQQERDSRFYSHAFSLGAALARTDINAVLDGEGAECTLNGLYVAAGSQVTDTHTLIEHAKPHCSSFEVYRGILDKRSRGVFSGRIRVRQDAQKTDAKQTNQNLLLSEDATINTKPQLEIFADDVRCTHGATVGQLSEDAVFYLRSRGIPLAEARSLLIHAFASEITNRVQVEPLRARLDQMLLSKGPLAGASGLLEGLGK